MEQNIRDLLKAVDALNSITGADMADMRMKMDGLLELWEGKAYLGG